MLKALAILTLTFVVTVLAGCASTSQPSSLTGDRPIVNDKGVVVGYHAR